MYLVCFNPPTLFESQLGTHAPGLFESQGGTHTRGRRRKCCDRVVLKSYTYCDIGTGVPLDKLFYTKSGEKTMEERRRAVGMLNATYALDKMNASTGRGRGGLWPRLVQKTTEGEETSYDVLLRF